MPIPLARDEHELQYRSKFLMKKGWSTNLPPVIHAAGANADASPVHFHMVNSRKTTDSAGRALPTRSVGVPLSCPVVARQDSRDWKTSEPPGGVRSAVFRGLLCCLTCTGWLRGFTKTPGYFTVLKMKYRKTIFFFTQLIIAEHSVFVL